MKISRQSRSFFREFEALAVDKTILSWAAFLNRKKLMVIAPQLGLDRKLKAWGIKKKRAREYCNKLRTEFGLLIVSC